MIPQNFNPASKFPKLWDFRLQILYFVEENFQTEKDYPTGEKFWQRQLSPHLLSPPTTLLMVYSLAISDILWPPLFAAVRVCGRRGIGTIDSRLLTEKADELNLMSLDWKSLVAGVRRRRAARWRSPNDTTQA